MKLNRVYLDRFKTMGHHYYFLVSKGIFLTFDSETLEYSGLYSIYNISDKTLVKEETKGLEKLYRLGWII